MFHKIKKSFDSLKNKLAKQSFVCSYAHIKSAYITVDLVIIKVNKLLDYPSRGSPKSNPLLNNQIQGAKQIKCGTVQMAYNLHVSG